MGSTRCGQSSCPDRQAHALNFLDQRYLNPMDPPWRADPDWLRRNGAQMIPVLAASNPYAPNATANRHQPPSLIRTPTKAAW